MSLKQCSHCNARFRGDVARCPIDGAPLTAPADPLIGLTIAGRYEVEELLGTGGMGAVYRARHKFIGRDVALKFLDPSLTENERLRKRFLGEARAANQINHEHIIDITDFGETEDGMVYMVMEYLRGRTVEEEIEQGPLDIRRALRIALQVGLGLGRAHRLGVVHRDIKPANIYLTERRMDPDFVKILDFGVARIEHDARITGQNMIVGTPEYIAPEQIRSGGVFASSDLYSLGCVMFEMLTGQLPFDGKTTILLVKHINDPPPIPSELNPAIPPAVDELVLRLLAKKPEERHRDAFHLVEDLQHLLDELPRGEAAHPARSDSDVGRRISVSQGQPEEESWHRTSALFRELVREAHPSGNSPHWLLETVAQIESRVATIRALRRQVTAAAEKATEQQEEVRKPRRQIGHALDELSQDDSRISRKITEIVEQLEPEETRLDAAMVAVLRGASPLRLKAGKSITVRDQETAKEVLRACKELAEARDAVADLKARLVRRQAERRDLQYQIAQLKQKLASLNESSTVDMEIWHDEVNRLSTQIQSELEAIAPLASRLSDYFRQYPELHQKLAATWSQAPPPLAGELH